MNFATHQKEKSNSLSCLILAAGFGSRLKNIGVKPLLSCRGKSFLRTIVENSLQANFSPVVSVVNHSNRSVIEKLKLPMKILINEAPENGMFSSVRIGVEHLAKFSSGILIIPVDYPLVKKTTYEVLASDFRSHQNSVIIPSLGKKSGHPVIIPAILFSKILQKALSATLRDVFAENRQLIRYVAVSDPGILININTETAYRKYCQ
ncbi:MAG: nucleotidyltransferase family protein [Calditrichaeota bacterium]|nr:nucleotidyltransferase family protein [Calditrichota bacterium]